MKIKEKPKAGDIIKVDNGAIGDCSSFDGFHLVLKCADGDYMNLHDPNIYWLKLLSEDKKTSMSYLKLHEFEIVSSLHD